MIVGFVGCFGEPVVLVWNSWVGGMRRSMEAFLQGLVEGYFEGIKMVVV